LFFQQQTSAQPEKVPLYHSELKEYPDKEFAFQILYSRSHTIIIQASNAVEKEEWYMLEDFLRSSLTYPPTI